MHASHIERRAAATAANDKAGSPWLDMSHVVRQGIAIQASLGTRSAVEFMKQHRIHGAVIHRVLMGEQVRSDDQAVIDDPRR